MIHYHVITLYIYIIFLFFNLKEIFFTIFNKEFNIHILEYTFIQYLLEVNATYRLSSLINSECSRTNLRNIQ